MTSTDPTLVPDPHSSRSSTTKANPTPLDVVFILFSSVALVVFVLSFSAVRAVQPDMPQWLIGAVSNVWNRLFLGAGAIGSLALRRWIDRTPAPNYLVWIPAFAAGLLAAVFFSVTRIIPPQEPVLSASIEEPHPGQTVTRRTFICRGKAIGLSPGTHLWLAIEVNNHIWPKEREVRVLADGTWENTIYEDGATDKFSISLLSANPAAQTMITQWIQAGEKTGQYGEMVGIPGTERIARIDGLRLKPN